MYVIWSLVLLLCFTGRVADGFSSGAPPSRCDNMVPAHRTGSDQILPQRSPLPYNFQLSKFTYSPGEQITMTLSGGQAGYFKGFLVKVISNQGVATGAMTAPGGLKTVTCGLNGNEALTHTESSQKPAVRFIWTAPSVLSGTLTVRATIVYSYATFWVNEIIATLQPAPTIRPQITTVSPPLTTAPVLTTSFPETTKPPELITHSKVITPETLTNVSDGTYIENTTAVVGKDNAQINETTNSSLGVGKLSFEENISYSITNTSNNNKTTNIIHDIAASLMLSKISALADDYYAFTNSLENATKENKSEPQLANPEATFLSVLDVKTNVQDGVNQDDKTLLINETTNSVSGMNPANTLQNVISNTILKEFSTQPDELNTRPFSTGHSEKPQPTLLSKTKFNIDTTTNSMTFFAKSTKPPLTDHTFETNTITSVEKSQTSLPLSFASHKIAANTYTRQSTESFKHTFMTSPPTISLSENLLYNKTTSTSQTTEWAISTPRNKVTQMKTTILNTTEQINTIATVNQTTATTTQIHDMSSKLSETNGTNLEMSTSQKLTSAKTPNTTRATPSLTSYLKLLNHTNETESNTINAVTNNTDKEADKHKQSTTEKYVLRTTEMNLKETTKTMEYTESDGKAYTNTDLQTTREVSTIITTNEKDATKSSVLELIFPKVSDDLGGNNTTITVTTVTAEIPEVKGVTELDVLVTSKEKIETTSVAAMGQFSTKDTLSLTDETSTALESTTSKSRSSTRFTTVTTLPPIIPRTFRPVRIPKFGPRTNDVWLKMNPVPVTVNNLFKLMPTTKRVWLKVEPTVRPPVFVPPVFKAPRLPEVTSTIETTTATATEPPVKVVPTVSQDGIIEYDPACGSSKGCFVDCTGDGCKFMVTWEDVGYGVRFELHGKSKHSESWIAVGFSKDTRMSDDSVVECIHSGGIVQAFNSYNPMNVMNNNRLNKHAITGLSEISGSYYDGVFKCRFTRAYRVEAEPRIFDLQKDWNIMFAHGNLAPGSTGKNRHIEMPAASASRIDYQSVVVVGKAAKFTLVKVHGCMMILAWVLFCGVGVCVARYYKNVWSDKTFLKLKIWFQVHRACMVTALVLDLIAFIIIFVDVKGYSQIPDIPGKSYLKSHPVLGIIVTLLCVANPIMALFRQGPTDSKRPIFNWAHWGVGISAYILSALTICFGFELGKASTPDYAVYIMIGYIVYIVLFDIACEVHNFLTKKEKKGKTEAMEMNNHNGTENGVPNGNSTKSTTKEKTRRSDKLKTVLLAFHIAFTGAFALVLVLVVALN